MAKVNWADGFTPVKSHALNCLITTNKLASIKVNVKITFVLRMLQIGFKVSSVEKFQIVNSLLSGTTLS